MRHDLVLADHDLDHLGRLLAALAHAGQVDHADGDERRADHEDDQQHQHHVDEGHHVDLVDGAAARAAKRGDGRHGSASRAGRPAGASGLGGIALKNVGKLFDEGFHLHRNAVDVAREAVVGDDRRDRGKQADGVATSASAMPGATVARDTCCRLARPDEWRA